MISRKAAIQFINSWNTSVPGLANLAANAEGSQTVILVEGTTRFYGGMASEPERILNLMSPEEARIHAQEILRLKNYRLDVGGVVSELHDNGEERIFTFFPIGKHGFIGKGLKPQEYLKVSEYPANPSRVPA